MCVCVCTFKKAQFHLVTSDFGQLTQEVHIVAKKEQNLRRRLQMHTQFQSIIEVKSSKESRHQKGLLS